MDLRRKLALVFAAAHPAEAAAALEDRPSPETAQVLRSLPATTAAGVLRRMAPDPAVRVLEELEPKDAVEILTELPLRAIATLLRRTHDEDRERILVELTPDLAQEIRTLVRFPDGTAGALMDPSVLTAHGDLTVEEAMAAVRREAQHALYNLYVVDRDHLLIGVLNLQELLRAPPRARLETIVHPAHHRLVVTDDRRSIVAHVGWREVYSLPVVDERGRFVGAVRYRTLRRMEEELQGPDTTGAGVTTAALGDLFRTGIVGMVDALSATLAPPPAKTRNNASVESNRREESEHGRDAEE